MKYILYRSFGDLDKDIKSMSWWLLKPERTLMM